MKALPPPNQLRAYSYFLLQLEKETSRFVLMIPNGDSFDLGQPSDAQRYFDGVGLPRLGERAIDCASNWRYAQVVIEDGHPRQGRAWGVDLDQICEADRLLGNQRFETDEVLMMEG